MKFGVPEEIDLALKQGRIDVVRDWIRQGGAIRFAEAKRKMDRDVLRLAAPTGFYSLVEFLLNEVEWSGEEKAYAFRLVLGKPRLRHILDLLMDHGCRLDHFRFCDFAGYGDMEFLNRCVEHGLDPEKDDAFAYALGRSQSRMLLRFYKENRERFPSLDRQMQRALLCSLDERDLKWSMLLLWAGADPYEVYQVEGDKFEGETGCERAAWMLDFDSIKKLKLKPNRDNRLRMLDWATVRVDADLVEWILEGLEAAALVPAPGESCKYLTRIILDEDFMSESTKDRTGDTLRCIELLAGKGSVWSCDAKSLATARKVLSKKSACHFAKTVQALFETNAADRELLWSLVSAPEVQERIKRDPRYSWYALERLLNLNLPAGFERKARGSKRITARRI